MDRETNDKVVLLYEKRMPLLGHPLSGYSQPEGIKRVDQAGAKDVKNRERSAPKP